MQVAHHQESEVKFYLADRAAFEARLIERGASLQQARLHEWNLRFDTPERTLTAQRRVLRLRQDASSYITYKGPARLGEEISVRQEIELVVDDFENARKLLEALGYEVSIAYEKFRTTYRWEGVLITLDEMPFGSFTELEGTDAAAIQRAADHFGLDWSARSVESYLALFNRLVETRSLAAKNLTFDELAGIATQAADLGMRPADMLA